MHDRPPVAEQLASALVATDISSERSLADMPALIEDEDVDPDSLKDMPPLEDVAPLAFPRGAPPRKRHCQEDA